MGARVSLEAAASMTKAKANCKFNTKYLQSDALFTWFCNTTLTHTHTHIKLKKQLTVLLLWCGCIGFRDEHRAKKRKYGKRKKAKLTTYVCRKGGRGWSNQISKGLQQQQQHNQHRYIHIHMYAAATKSANLLGTPLNLQFSLFSLIPSFHLLAPTFLGLGLPPG